MRPGRYATLRRLTGLHASNPAIGGRTGPVPPSPIPTVPGPAELVGIGEKPSRFAAFVVDLQRDAEADTTPSSLLRGVRMWNRASASDVHFDHVGRSAVSSRYTTGAGGESGDHCVNLTFEQG